MNLRKNLLLVSAIAAVAIFAIGCSKAPEDTGASNQQPSTTGSAPGETKQQGGGASAPMDLQAAPPGVQTGTPSGAK